MTIFLVCYFLVGSMCGVYAVTCIDQKLHNLFSKFLIFYLVLASWLAVATVLVAEFIFKKHGCHPPEHS